MDSSLAAKSFIVNDSNELLVVKRSENDKHSPGIWEIPGGRIMSGENPVKGLKRETLEETGLEIKVVSPMGLHDFIREDGQEISMLIFLCKPMSGKVTLSNEHTDHAWVKIEDCYDMIHPSFHNELDFFRQIFTDRKSHCQ